MNFYKKLKSISYSEIQSFYNFNNNNNKMKLIICLIFINMVGLMAFTKKGKDVYITHDRNIIRNSGKIIPFPDGYVGFIFDCTCGDPILPDQENCRSRDKDTSMCYNYFDEEGIQLIKDKIIYFYPQTYKTPIAEVSIVNVQLINNNTISLIYEQAPTRKYDGSIPHWCNGCWTSKEYASCVPNFDCRESELFHMIIDRYGDQKTSTVTTKLTDAFKNRVTQISGKGKYITSNCGKNFDFQFKRNFEGGYYLVFNRMIFEFDNSGLYKKTLNGKYANGLNGCSGILMNWVFQWPEESDFGEDVNYHFVGSNTLKNDYEKFGGGTGLYKFFDITKLSNGKTIIIYTQKVNNKIHMYVRNIDLLDNFGNVIVHQEIIDLKSNENGWARIFPFEGGYFVIWKANRKLMIMKFNFQGLVIGEIEEIYEFSVNLNLGSVIKEGNKFSIVRFGDYSQSTQDDEFLPYTFQSTNNEYVIEYIEPKSKEEDDRYAMIANDVYTGSVLHDVEYELDDPSGDCWRPSHFEENYSICKCSDRFNCYDVIYKRESVVDINNPVSISTPGTLPPTPIPTESPSSYPTSIPTFSRNPTFLPTVAETDMPTINHLDQIIPPESDDDEHPENAPGIGEEIDPPDSTDDTDSTDDKNTEDSKVDSEENSPLFIVVCIFGSVIVLLLCYIKLTHSNVECTTKTENHVERTTHVERTLSFVNNRNNETNPKIREQSKDRDLAYPHEPIVVSSDNEKPSNDQQIEILILDNPKEKQFEETKESN